MPTTRPRHTITETPPVQEALDELRSKLGDGEQIDFAELVTLGAQVKARQLSTDEQVTSAVLRSVADMIRTRSIPVDVDAADEVKHLGLIPKYE